MRILGLIASALGIGEASGLQPASPGGATEALLGSINRVTLAAVAVWQAAMVIVTLASSATGSGPLALAQAFVAVLAMASRRRLRWRTLLAVGMAAAGVWCYLVSGDIDSALTFAACWQINFASFVAGLLVLRRYTVLMVMGSAAAASATILVFLPEWGIQLPVSVFVTQTTIVLAIRLGVGVLLRSSASVDRAIRDADAAALRSVSLAHVSARIAEESRVLHDTAINTFAAIASAGAGVKNYAQVRAQCARDVEQIAQLRGKRDASRTQGTSIAEVFDQPGLPVHRRGADDADVARIDRALPADMIRAVVGCVREAVNNASKHSGAAHVDIELLVKENELLVLVSDNGVGFAPDTAKKRGLAASIERRASEHGFDADVRSSPGAGTTVAVRVPLGAGEPARPALVDDSALADAARTTRRRAGMYWGVGVTAESIVLTLTGGTNEDLALLPMILVMGLSVLVTTVPAVRRTALAPLLLIVATSTVFFFSAQATGFGIVGPTHWQALAAAGPFVLLLSVTDNRPWRLTGAAAWIAAVVAIAVTTVPSSLTAAAIVVLAGLVGLGFSLVWGLFQGFMSKLSEVAADARHHEFEARMRGEREAAAQVSYRRWTEAGLDDADGLLRGIRDGAVDPGADSTRVACDQEERYLRQLVLISPELVHLGTSFMPLLRQARDAEVRLALRLGDRDASDTAIAASMAAVVQLNIAAAGRGGSLSATLFPVADGLQLTITGAGLRVPARIAEMSRLVRIGETELLEVDFATEAPKQREMATGGAGIADHTEQEAARGKL